jgi:hypothetical protein
LDGSEVLKAPPDSVVNVKVDAKSSANSPLHYRWSDSTGASLPGDGASVQWRLPGTAAANAVFVEVSDGHGGVARASLPLATAPGPPTAQGQSPTTPAPSPRFNVITHPTGGLRPTFPHPGGDPFIDPSLFMPCVNQNGTTDCSAAAIQYYKTIGVFDVNGHPTGSYVNFRTWKAAWGFSDDPRHPATNETRAVYYNNGDLQFGRDMHCRATPGVIDPTVAYLGGVVINVCYVANYSDGTASPGRDPQASVVNAENNSNPIAAVAMLGINQQPLVTAPPNFPFTWGNFPTVQFIVFAPTSFATHLDIDNFVPSIAAILDSEGPKAVPGVCMACHNGSDNGTHPTPTVGPRFLPFDTPSFLYDTANASFSSDSQSEKFRTLNGIARDADTDGGSAFPGGTILFGNPSITSQTIRDLIAGWYSWCGGVDQTNCKIDDVGHPFIPTGTCASADAPATCGWTGNGLYSLAYQQIPRVACRGCHVAHSDKMNMQNFQKFNAFSSLICADLDSGRMPFAEIPYNRFWGTAIDKPALEALIGAVSPSTQCQLTQPH